MDNFCRYSGGWSNYISEHLQPIPIIIKRHARNLRKKEFGKDLAQRSIISIHDVTTHVIYICITHINTMLCVSENPSMITRETPRPSLGPCRHRLKDLFAYHAFPSSSVWWCWWIWHLNPRCHICHITSLEKETFSLSTALFFINEMKIDSADILFFALCEMNKVRVAGKSWVVANFWADW